MEVNAERSYIRSCYQVRRCVLIIVKHALGLRLDIFKLTIAHLRDTLTASAGLDCSWHGAVDGIGSRVRSRWQWMRAWNTNSSLKRGWDWSVHGIGEFVWSEGVEIARVFVRHTECGWKWELERWRALLCEKYLNTIVLVPTRQSGLCIPILKQQVASRFCHFAVNIQPRLWKRNRAQHSGQEFLDSLASANASRLEWSSKKSNELPRAM